MRDFWRDSGYHLLARRADGRLAVTDDFLRAYLRRPELAPVAESCPAERRLHAELLDDPRKPVPQERLSELADPDAWENYRVLLRFRDRLLAAGTLEDCYLQAFTGAQGIDVPPLFLDQLVHAILRGMLEGCDDALRLRAAELLFREQTVSIQDGAIMAADSETVEMYARSGGFGALGQLLVEAQASMAQVELDVLTRENAEVYWGRNDRFDTVLNLGFAGDGLDALCRVLEAWIAHFLSVEVSIQPVQQIRDEKWVWHIGLDSEGTRLLNDLYQGREVGDERLARLLSLFRLEFKDPRLMPRAIAGRPVYLAMAMTERGRLRLKPQNLLVNLPLAERS